MVFDQNVEIHRDNEHLHGFNLIIAQEVFFDQYVNHEKCVCSEDE